jgi:hypothetical protein
MGSDLVLTADGVRRLMGSDLVLGSLRLMTSAGSDLKGIDLSVTPEFENV